MISIARSKQMSILNDKYIYESFKGREIKWINYVITGAARFQHIQQKVVFGPDPLKENPFINAVRVLILAQR